MTYDENDEYNGPDIHRRGPFLFMAAIVGVILVAGGVAAVSDARAEPAQTVLPADGVLSITRTGDVWSVTTDGIPSEVKIMSPVNQPICGVNYPTPCTNVTTFTVAADCTLWQIDGLPGWNSSDPYICLGGTPSTPTTTTSPTPSESASPTPVATEPATPLPTPTATTDPSPSPTPTSSPTSTPEPSSNPSPPSPLPTPRSSLPATDASTGSPTLTGSTGSESAPARLADTGIDAAPIFVVAALVILAGLIARLGAVEEPFPYRWVRRGK